MIRHIWEKNTRGVTHSVVNDDGSNLVIRK